MRKFFLFWLLILNLVAFSQSEYSYKAKFEKVNDATKAAQIIKAMKMVFKTDAVYNESNSLIEFNSKMSISQTVFNNMMSGEGFAVESFERHEIKAETTVEVKKVVVDTSAKTTSTAVKKEAQKSRTPTTNTQVKPK